jgi:hypothetical protein
MSAKKNVDYKEIKDILKDKNFKRTADKLLEHSTSLIAKKIKGIFKKSAKVVLEMLIDSDDSDSDKDDAPDQDKDSIDYAKISSMDHDFMNSISQTEKNKKS